MQTVAEHLKPPFIAGIMLDVIEADLNDGPSPSDEMLSIAPVQDGFLGLETTHDDQGRWISVSYWLHEKYFARWREVGAVHVARQFDGLKLDHACKFRISKIDDQILVSKPLRANERVIPLSGSTAALNGFGSRVVSAFPALAGLLGYEHTR